MPFLGEIRITILFPDLPSAILAANAAAYLIENLPYKEVHAVYVVNEAGEVVHHAEAH